MEGHCSTGQSPHWAVAPMEEEEEEEEAGYCQPLGYYKRWQNQNSNYATGWTTRGQFLVQSTDSSLLQIIQSSSSAH